MNKNNKDEYIIYLIGIIPVIWLSLIVAPYIHDNIFDMFDNIMNNIETPFKIRLVSDSIEVAIIFIFVYFIGIILYLSTKKNYRKKEEHGSAKWGNIKKINKKYI